MIQASLNGSKNSKTAILCHLHNIFFLCVFDRYYCEDYLMKFIILVLYVIATHILTQLCFCPLRGTLH